MRGVSTWSASVNLAYANQWFALLLPGALYLIAIAIVHSDNRSLRHSPNAIFSGCCTVHFTDGCFYCLPFTGAISVEPRLFHKSVSKAKQRTQPVHALLSYSAALLAVRIAEYVGSIPPSKVSFNPRSAAQVAFSFMRSLIAAPPISVFA